MSLAIDAEIRLLDSTDLEGALLLSSTAGWNQRLADWRMLLQLAPSSSFTALADGRIVGTAIGIDYGHFAWIAMMLVDPAYRGRGLGARLLEAAMDAVAAGRPVRLDATPMGRPLYQRYGFEDEAMLTRHAASTVARPRDGWTPASTPVRHLTAGDLDVVAAIDRQAFAGDRRAVLEWAHAGAPGYAQIIETPAGAQYCFGRSGRLFDQIGPVVAVNDRDAQQLVGAALRAAEGKPAVLDAFDTHSGFTARLRAFGFDAQRPLFRMCRPGAMPVPPNGSHSVEYAILGPEFA